MRARRDSGFRGTECDQRDVALLAAIEDGLPLCARPFAQIGEAARMDEGEVLARLRRMCAARVIRRLGLVLQHRALGYRANAMVVWDVPDADIDDVAQKIVAHDFVTLCYCRERRAPDWPYNLYCMIHGRERRLVECQIAAVKRAAGLDQYPSRTLFSSRRFKQRGARFSAPAPIPMAAR